MLELPNPAVMGILNITPDSFSDGGNYLSVDHALRHAAKLIKDGADIIDIGGESTRPGASQVSSIEELDRVMPVIEKLRSDDEILISIDTSSPEVISAAGCAGVNLINDVRALRREGAIEAAAKTGLPVCLVHMQGDPMTMQDNPTYKDLIAEINCFFKERIDACKNGGIDESQIILDPGFGFGKTAQQNLQIINRLATFKELHKPILVGLSRKGTISKILALVNGDRKIGSVAGALIAVRNGAAIVRVHDVAETVAALAVNHAVDTEGKSL